MLPAQDKFTKKTYRRICKAEGIIADELELNRPGYFVVSRKRRERFIFIKSGLPKDIFLEITAHHLGNLKKQSLRTDLF